VHAGAADEYAALKRRLAAEFSGDDFASREGYSAAKSEFVERILQRARAGH
jgi:GrpB-like predicted nucleotidyltransferase (UPF0157 family)